MASAEERISVCPRYFSQTSRLLFYEALPGTLPSRSLVSLFLPCFPPLSLKLIINLRQPRAWKPKPKLHFPAAAVNGRLLLTLQELLLQSQARILDAGSICQALQRAAMLQPRLSLPARLLLGPGSRGRLLLTHPCSDLAAASATCSVMLHMEAAIRTR